MEGVTIYGVGTFGVVGRLCSIYIVPVVVTFW